MTAKPAGNVVVLISADTISDSMAGPALRVVNLARVLSNEFEVRVGAPPGSKLDALPSSVSGFIIDNNESEIVPQMLADARAVFAQGMLFSHIPFLRQTSAVRIVDGYTPYVAEVLARGYAAEGLQNLVSELMHAYLAGDYFVCASERQRDWWLGALEVAGRVNALTYAEDASLRSLIDVVPWASPSIPFVRQPSGFLQKLFPTISADAQVLLWGGGLWPWLDPLTAVRAMPKIVDVLPQACLVFPGTRHPNPILQQDEQLHGLIEAVHHEVKALGLTQHVYLYDGWISQRDWPKVLSESRVALALHHPSYESRFAWRTRMLDYLWAGLPIISTTGETLGEQLASSGIVKLVPEHDALVVAEAAITFLTQPLGALEPEFARQRAQFTWESAVKPLRKFLRSPRIAPDRVNLHSTLGNYYYANTQRELIAIKGSKAWKVITWYWKWRAKNQVRFG